MRTHPKPIAGIVLWGALAAFARIHAAEQNVIRSVDVAERDGAVELAIQGTRAPSSSPASPSSPRAAGTRRSRVRPRRPRRRPRPSRRRW